MESMLDLLFDTTKGAMFLVAIAIVLYVIHSRAGKHAFCSPDSAARRTDIDRADRTQGSALQSHNPHRFATIVRAQDVICCGKARVRRVCSMTRDSVSSA